MFKHIILVGKLLVIEVCDDGVDRTIYINRDNIIAIEFGCSIVSILCINDVNYSWDINSVDEVVLRSTLPKIF